MGKKIVRKARTSKRKRSQNNQIKREYNFMLKRRNNEISAYNLKRVEYIERLELLICFNNVKDLKRDTKAARVGKGARSFGTERELYANELARVAAMLF